MPEPSGLVALGGRLKPWQAGLLAISATAATFGLRVALDVPLGGQPTLIIFTLPIMLSAYAGGLRAGLLATATSFFGASYYLLPPINSFAIDSGVHRWQLFFVALAGISISALSESLHRARLYALHVERQNSAVAARLAAIVASSNDAIVGKDLQGIVTSWNQGAERLFGYPAREMIGQSILRLIPPVRHAEEATILAQIVRGESVRHFETVRLRKDGRAIDISVTVSAIKDAAGTIVGASKMAHDVTERKHLESQLRESEERFRAVADQSLQGLILFQDGSATYVNPAFCDITGYSAAEVMAQTDEQRFAMIHADNAAPVLDRKRRYDLGEPIEEVSEIKITRKDGQLRWVLSSNRAFTLQGKPSRLGVIVDITERKDVEAALHDSEGKLRKVIDGLGPYMFVGLMTPDGLLIEANRPALDAAGLKPEDVLGKPFAETYWWAWSEPVREQLNAAIARAAAGVPSRYDVSVRVAEATFIWIDFSLFPVHNAGGEVIFLVPSGIVIDERKRAEAALRELTHRLLHAEDDERRRIAKELHDSTAQDLVAVLLNLGSLRDSLPDIFPAPAQIIDDSIALLESSAHDIRTLSYALHPPRLDEVGLHAGLVEYAAGLSKRAGLRIQVEAAPDFGRLPDGQERSLFRVAQESLGNVVRHSASETATIRLARQGASIVLEIEDQGCGLPPDLATRPGAQGVGITGMRERLQHLGGRLEINSSGSGTTVRAVLPWHGDGP